MGLYGIKAPAGVSQWSAVTVMETVLRFQQVQVPIEAPVGAGDGRGILPDLAFAVDSSGSMGYAPLEGEGEYDLLLRAVFGVFRWLENRGVASFLRYAVLNFSSVSTFSGWNTWVERESLHRALFDYKGERTVFGVEQAGRMIREAPRPFTMVMISDGELDNDVEAADFVKSRFAAPHGFTLVQVGASTRFCRTIEKARFPVHGVESFADLQELVLGAVKTKYAA